MNNLPKTPVNWLAHNADLLKSQEVLSGGSAGTGTDYKPEVLSGQLEAKVVSSFNAPTDRVNGNVLFRRLPSGELDYEAAKHIIIDILHKEKDKAYLTPQEQLAIGCVFPTLFTYVDSSFVDTIRNVNFRISDMECMQLTFMVAAHLAAELNYNAGLGGGSVPGREQTRS